MELNQVTYGNPKQSVKLLLSKKGLVDSLFEELKNTDMPLNDSELTKEELNEVAEGILLLEDKENDYFLKRYKSYDRSLIQSLTTIFKQRGIDIEEVCMQIQDDINPLIAKLKVHFNRPRPYQIDSSIEYLESSTGQTPSMPAGHAFQAYYLTKVLSKKYPEKKKTFEDIANKCNDCRIRAGIHYPSDGELSKTLVDLFY